jgi:hypothetical protein
LLRNLKNEILYFYLKFFSFLVVYFLGLFDYLYLVKLYNMNSHKSNIEVIIDIDDFKTDNDILMSVKKFLKLYRDRNFISSFRNSESDYEIKPKIGIRVRLRHCDC